MSTETPTTPNDAQPSNDLGKGEDKPEETASGPEGAPEPAESQRVGESNVRHGMEGADPRTGRGGEPGGPHPDEVGKDKDVGDGAVAGRVG
jgi:hypothetical protein